MAGAEIGLAVIVLAALVAFVVLRPLFGGGDEPPAGDERRASLEVAKEAKYREIRDAELDLRMGKLSEADHRSTDRELREQAIAILREIDGLERGRRYPARAMVGILSGVQIILSVAVILLILLHSGKDAGLSGAFGVGTGAGPLGGGSLVERNLDRWTIAFSLLWVLNVIVLIKL